MWSYLVGFLAVLGAAAAEPAAASTKEKDAAKLVSQADREFRNDRADIALKLYTEALQLDKSPKTYYARHKVYLKKGKLQQAIKDLTTAVEIDADYSMAYLQRANLFLTVGKCAEATADYTRTLALDPKKKDAQVRQPHAQACAQALVRAELAEGARNWAAARDALSDAMAPDRATAAPALLLRRARAHLELRELELAMGDSGKASGARVRPRRSAASPTPCCLPAACCRRSSSTRATRRPTPCAAAPSTSTATTRRPRRTLESAWRPTQTARWGAGGEGGVRRVQAQAQPLCPPPHTPHTTTATPHPLPFHRPTPRSARTASRS